MALNPSIDRATAARINPLIFDISQKDTLANAVAAAAAAAVEFEVEA